MVIRPAGAFRRVQSTEILLRFGFRGRTICNDHRYICVDRRWRSYLRLCWRRNRL